MKTLYFQKHSPEKNLYYCSINGKCFEHDESGTYVLASEAEAEIASLKKQYADSCSESDSMLPEIKELRTQLTAAAERNAELEAEVERLRKALEAVRNAYEHRPMVDSNDLYTIAKAALEASDG